MGGICFYFIKITIFVILLGTFGEIAESPRRPCNGALFLVRKDRFGQRGPKFYWQNCRFGGCLGFFYY